MNDCWQKKDVWRKIGKNFLIEVYHYTEGIDDIRDLGPHRWNVYAYIYPKHLRFSMFSGSQLWQEAATGLPLHCGPSFLCYHYSDDQKIMSVQVGSDYNHLYDERFSNYADENDAFKVFRDAEELFSFLERESDELTTPDPDED